MPTRKDAGDPKIDRRSCSSCTETIRKACGRVDRVEGNIRRKVIRVHYRDGLAGGEEIRQASAALATAWGHNDGPITKPGGQ